MMYISRNPWNLMTVVLNDHVPQEFKSLAFQVSFIKAMIRERPFDSDFFRGKGG